MISYEPFWKTLEERGITCYALVHKLGIPNGTLARMKHNRSITADTVDRLCKVVKCRVEDIMVYIEEE